MVPLGIDKTIDKIKMMEGRTSAIRKAVHIAFSRAMNHLSRVQDEPTSDLSDIDWPAQLSEPGHAGDFKALVFVMPGWHLLRGA